MNNFHIIIPARYASTRFPGKPLADINGKSMIQRVYERAKKVKNAQNVVVATDDERIYNHVKSFFGEVVMTNTNHQSGTDRCSEAADILKLKNEDIIVNIQGDEPFLEPSQIESLLSSFENQLIDIATLVKLIEDESQITNTNIPKVVFDKNKKALFFSRSTIPYNRNKVKKINYYKHIGVYAYRIKTLKELVQIPISSLEKTEMLEQLRWIENGYDIYVNLTNYESLAVDTPEDLEKIKKVYLKN